ncbi:MAG: hypothetical protein II399_08780 [Lachnospiraceae bacterium]|nr:hypothetical protein [Lachnospiraceae bacterium]
MVTLKIKELVEKSNSRTKRKYTRVMFENGQDAICWVPELIEGLQAGDTADFEISTSETGISTITACNKPEPAPAPAAEEEDVPFEEVPAAPAKANKPEPAKKEPEVKPQPEKEEKAPAPKAQPKAEPAPAAPAPEQAPAAPAPTDADIPVEATELPKRKISKTPVPEEKSVWGMYKDRKEAFPLLTADEIEVRVAQCTAKGVSLLLYKDARADQIRFDALFGPMGWQKKYRSMPEFPGRLICEVSVKDPETGEWISKEDFGTESNTEAEKGQASDAFKRACVCWGSGRELYSAPFIWVKGDDTLIEKDDKGRFRCKDTFMVKSIGYDDHDQIAKLEIYSKAKRKVVFSY